MIQIEKELQCRGIKKSCKKGGKQKRYKLYNVTKSDTAELTTSDEH